MSDLSSAPEISLAEMLPAPQYAIVRRATSTLAIATAAPRVLRNTP
jgi:hypothetical protein